MSPLSCPSKQVKEEWRPQWRLAKPDDHRGILKMSEAVVDAMRLGWNWLKGCQEEKERCISNVGGYHDSVPGSPFHGPTISLVIQPP